MRLLPLALLSVLLLSGFNACATDPIGLCEAQAKARCELAFQCCKDKERIENAAALGLQQYMNSEGECVDRLSGVCTLAAGGTNDSVNLGRTKFDVDKANACVDALNTARDACSINDFNAALVGDDCGSTLEGLVADGDDCANDGECADHGFCNLGDLSDPDVDKELGSLVGQCIGPSGDGESCEAPRSCADGLECDFNTTPPSCFTPPGAGDQCRNGACAEGLFCSFADNTCQTPPGGGQPCPDFVCADGFTCAFDSAAGTDTCQPLPGIGEQCPSFACASGAFCDSSAGFPGTCAAQKNAGETCTGNDAGECKGDTSFCDTSQSPPRCASFDGTPPTDLDICTGK